MRVEIFDQSKVKYTQNIKNNWTGNLFSIFKRALSSCIDVIHLATYSIYKPMNIFLLSGTWTGIGFHYVMLYFASYVGLSCFLMLILSTTLTVQEVELTSCQ